MANPFVGTWDTIFDHTGNVPPGTPPGSCTLTITESFRFERSENIVDGMHEGAWEGPHGKQPSTLRGTFNPKDSTLTGTWVNTPAGAPEYGSFTLTLGPRKNTFTGKFGQGGQGDDAQKWNWNGALKRQHIDVKPKISIPDLPKV